MGKANLGFRSPWGLNTLDRLLEEFEETPEYYEMFRHAREKLSEILDRGDWDKRALIKFSDEVGRHPPLSYSYYDLLGLINLADQDHWFEPELTDCQNRFLRADRNRYTARRRYLGFYD